MNGQDAGGEVTQFTGSEGNILAATCYECRGREPLPPVVLMHGGGQTRHSWKGGAERLAAQGYTSYTVDARGHGDSDWLENGHYRLDFFGADLWAILEQVQERHGTQPILIGASLGGLSALMVKHMAIEKGEMAPYRALIMVDIVPNMASSGVDRILGFMAARMRDGFEKVEDAADAIAAYLPGRARPKSLDGLSKNLRQRGDGRWYWHWDPLFVDGKDNIQTRADLAPSVLEQAASQLEIPVLLVRGGKSELVTQEAADAFLALVPDGHFADVSDAGHMVAGDKNDVFVDAVIRFLKNNAFK